MAWRLHITAKDDRGAAKVAARVADLLDGRLDVVQIEQYWKIEEQRIAAGDLPLHAATLPEAVVESLQLASRVAAGWHVTCPEQAADGTWHFDGSASENFSVAGLAFATWSVSRPLAG